jgi:hypothetical protein
MVGRSRWKKEEDMDEKTTRMLFATVALSALAVLFAGPAGANISQGDGVSAVASSETQAQVAGPGTIPYLSQGVGVDTSLFDGRSPQVAQTGTRLSGVHAALQSQARTSATAPLPHGAEVVLSPPSEEPQALGLTGDSALTRSVPIQEPVGLSGDSAATRYLPVSTPSTPTVTTSSRNDFGWTSFGAGAGMVALLGAGLAGVLLTVRRRHSVGLP